MVEQLLGGLFGGQEDEDDDRRRGRAQDFVSRYEQGPPWEGIGADEAYHNYRNVAERLSPQEYEEAAAEAFARLSPQDRMQFARMMQERAGGQVGDYGDYQVDDPRQLARVTSQARQRSGGGLADLLGGAMGGQRRGGGGGGSGVGDMLDNPIAKAALAGIAAMAMKKVMR